MHIDRSSSLVSKRTGLVLTGGGARGAYQVGVLKALAEALPGPSPFDVITGVSVGAINAVVLAEGADDFPAAVEKLEYFWRSLHCDSVFVADPLALFGRFSRWGGAVGLGWTGLRPPKSLFDATPLMNMIASEVDFDRVRRMVGSGALNALAVTASSYATGEAVSFVQARPGNTGWTRARRLGVMADLKADHIMASAALPAVFQARRLGSHWFGDGALRQTAPLSPAIHLGCNQLLTISPRDGMIDAAKETSGRRPHPSFGFLGGQMLDILFNDNLDADIERLERVNATCRVMSRDAVARSGLREIGTRLVRPSSDLRQIAGAHFKELPWSLKRLLKVIGAARAPWVMPSYLNFEPGYVGALIDLGYKDGRAQLTDLTAYLGTTRILPHAFDDAVDGLSVT